MHAAVNIADMRAAIADGTVPGAFSADRTRFEFPTLTYAGARAPHEWKIIVTLLAPAAGAPAGALAPVPITDDMLAPGGAAPGALAPPPLPAGARAEIRTETRQVGGKLREVVPTYVTEGKKLGKKGATNALTQALRNALGLYNKQRRRSAPTDAAAAAAAAPAAAAAGAPPAPAAAAAGAPPAPPAPAAAARPLQPPPQLIKSAADSPLTAEDFAAGVTVQRKLNGVRVVASAVLTDKSAVLTDKSVKVSFYSRSALEYEVPPALSAQVAGLIAAWRARRPAEFAAPGLADIYIDGELYKHGVPLNVISGQARRSAAAAADINLEFHVFDVFFPAEIAAGRDMASRDRQRAVDALFACAKPPDSVAPLVRRVENFAAADQAAVDGLAQGFLAAGFEGAVARRDGAGYRYSASGYHSANAVKIKPTFDAEFPVVGYTQGARGKDVGAVIWECEVPPAGAPSAGAPASAPEDRRFMVVPKLPYEVRRCLFAKLGENVALAGAPPLTRFERDVRGAPLTVEYKEVSAKTGKPLQAHASVFRTYEAAGLAAAAEDPIAKLLRECGA